MRARRGFSLIELVIVIVIIGIVSAIAIPRMSRGSVPAAESAFAGNLATLRAAIEYYRAEHQMYPTCDAVTMDQTSIMQQLTQFTDTAGNRSTTRSAMFRYGPYLQKVPPVSVGAQKGSVKIATAAAPDVGWLYDPATGVISGNTGAMTDSSGTRAYSDY